MSIKFLVLAILLASTLSFSLLANYQPPLPIGVKKIKENNNGSYRVVCNDNSKGTISFEEGSMCVFSKKNRKNRCEEKWTQELAADFICDGDIADEAPTFNDEGNQ